jgi:hypothetical protein
MQKVFILLRNNQQTGPFSLEEIIQFDLKPYDLIWIEGKSAGWYYPQEIKALLPHLSFIKQPTQPDAEARQQPSPANPFEPEKPKKVFVSMPASTVQEKMDSKPVPEPFTVNEKQPYKPSEPIHYPTEPELKTTYAKSLEEVEAEYTSWIYQKKTKKKSTVSKRGTIAACLLVSVAFGAWWVVTSFSDLPNDKPEQMAVTAVQNEIQLDSAAETNTIGAGLQSSAKKGQPGKVAPIKKETAITKNDGPKKVINKVVLNDDTTVNNDYEATTPDKQESNVAVDIKKPEPIAEATKEKKKKIGEKFLDLFKKKPEEQKNEDVKTTENENGERRSVRRETNLATQVTIKFEVPNDWMMGIKGAKASLTNRSTGVIAKAIVEVQYYNEDNELLQIKTVSFSNIGAKKTAIVSIPDHSFADHLDYKIVSVQGAAEPFAKL